MKARDEKQIGLREDEIGNTALKTCLLGSMLHACQTWSRTNKCKRKIVVLERKYYRNILQISQFVRITNGEVYQKI